MSKKPYIVLLLLGSCLVVQAQGNKNLNPTVEVTNAYKHEASGIEKPSQLRQLPDSVSRFNYDIDYSVRSTPYQGSYEFKPYNVQLRPAPMPSSENKLFARLGLGYSFHPLAEAVWTPVMNDNLRVNVYGSYKGYSGLYRDIQPSVDSFVSVGDQSSAWHESAASLGSNLLLDWHGGSLSADLRYTGISGTDAWAAVSTHGISLNAGLNGVTGSDFSYRLSEYVKYSANPAVKELHNKTGLGFSIPVSTCKMNLDVNAQVLSYADASVNATAGNFSFNPSISLMVREFNIKAGLKFGFVLRSDSAFAPYKAGIIFPDIHVSYEMLPGEAVLFADITGGNTINSIDKLSCENHFIGSFAFSPDVTVIPIKAAIGLCGHIFTRLQYKIDGGFYRIKNAFSYGYSAFAAGYTPVSGYMTPLNSFFASLQMNWKSTHLTVDGNVHYQYTLKPTYDTVLQQCLFAPPALKADVTARYTFAGRFAVNVSADALSERRSFTAKLPAFVDLGAGADFRMNHYLDFFLKFGNLLNQDVQRTPFHAEKGLYFTLGASLNF